MGHRSATRVLRPLLLSSMALTMCTDGPYQTSEVAASHEEAITGVAIVGMVTGDPTVENGNATTTELLETTLLRDFVSLCYADVNAIPVSEGGHLCPTSGPIDVDTCEGDLCMQEIFRCVGHRFMELATIVAPMKIHVDRLGITSGELVATNGDGRAEDIQYRIAPQAVEDRTVAYKLANEAFAAGASEAGSAVLRTADCLTTFTDSSDVIGEATTKSELFVVSFGDIAHSFSLQQPYFA